MSSLTGIDVPIALIRDDLANYLWLETTDKIYYGKAYRNEKIIDGTTQLIPEIFSQNGEYQEVLLDTNYNVNVFFDAGDTRENLLESPESDIVIHFAVNLDAIYPGESYRPEENVHRDVIDVLRHSRNAYSINSIDIENGIIGYGDFFTNNVKQFNMHPYHVFSVNLNVNFTYDCGNPYTNTVPEGGFVYPFPIILTN